MIYKMEVFEVFGKANDLAELLEEIAAQVRQTEHVYGVHVHVDDSTASVALLSYEPNPEDDPADGELPALDHGQDGDELLADIVEHYQEQAAAAPAGVELVTREVDGVLVVEPVQRGDEGIEE